MRLTDVRNSLGTPAYENDAVMLYQGDCLSFLHSLPDECIPLTVTSPPYNIGKAYETKRALDDYISWSEHWISQIYRVTTGNGAFWLNLGYVSIPGRAKAIPLPYLLWDKIPFFLIQEVVWNYGAGVAGRKFFSPRNEKFLWYVKNEYDYTFNLDAVRDPNVKYPNQKKNGKLKCNPAGKNPSDVWNIPKVTSGKNRASPERTPHPAQFPLDLVSRVILASSNMGDLVLDPFAGSSSLLEAAMHTGRKAVGFEINDGYLNLSIERLERSRRDIELNRAQTSLFDSAGAV